MQNVVSLEDKQASNFPHARASYKSTHETAIFYSIVSTLIAMCAIWALFPKLGSACSLCYLSSYYLAMKCTRLGIRASIMHTSCLFTQKNIPHYTKQ